MLSQTTEYALRAVVALAKNVTKAHTAQELAELTQVPPGYMSKVLLGMAKSGLVNSQRGLGGGFTLARSPEFITILDVVNIFDKVQRLDACPLGLPDHENLCPLHRRLDDAAGAMEDAFSRSTIAELVSEELAGMCPLHAPLDAGNPPPVKLRLPTRQKTA